MAKIQGYIGESPLYFRQLSKFQGCIGESTVDFRQLSQNKIIIGHVSLIHNPIGEILGEMLAEVQ